MGHGQRGFMVNIEDRDEVPWGMGHMGDGGTWVMGHMDNGAHGQLGTWS